MVNFKRKVDKEVDRSKDTSDDIRNILIDLYDISNTETNLKMEIDGYYTKYTAKLNLIDTQRYKLEMTPKVALIFEELSIVRDRLDEIGYALCFEISNNVKSQWMFDIIIIERPRTFPSRG